MQGRWDRHTQLWYFSLFKALQVSIKTLSLLPTVPEIWGIEDGLM